MESASAGTYDGDVIVQTGEVELEGILTVPEGASGIVVFAHGSGSSRLSPRNQEVARSLNERGLATLLFDLLTASEHEIDVSTRHLRFDIPLLGGRLAGAVDWVSAEPRTENLTIGLFGASTGAAAALIAATERPDRVAAVVSRGGRPDLAEPVLPQVRCPVLLIVGGFDTQVIEMNRGAADLLASKNQLEIVQGASHLFEEPGKLEEVSRLAADWFLEHLTASS